MHVFDRHTWYTPGDGRGITVAVLDSGFSRGHPALNRVAIAEARSFVGGNPLDDLIGHGTECTSILVAQRANLQGIAPAVDLYIGQMLDRAGRGAIEVCCQALDWVHASKVDILAIPSGRLGDHPQIRDHIDRILAQDTLIFAPVGNPFTGQCQPLYPAAYAGVFAIGSEIYQDTYRSWTHPPLFGMAAQGVEVCRASGGWAIAYDTSHATLLMAGLAARFGSWHRATGQAGCWQDAFIRQCLSPAHREVNPIWERQRIIGR